MSISNPTDISNCLLWCEPQSSNVFQLNNGTTAAGNGDPVGYVEDQSGNGKHAVSPDNSTTRPTLVADVYDGTRAVVRSDGSNDYLSSAIASLAQPCSISILFRKNSAAANQVPWAGNNQIFIYAFGASAAKFHAGNDVDFNIDVTQFNVVTAVYNGASSFIRVNAAKTTGDPGSTGFGTGLFVGGWGGTFPFDGDFVGWALYDKALSDAECDDLQDYWENGATDSTPPTLSGAATNSGGTQITATLSESGCTADGGGSSGSGGFSLSGTSATVSGWSISGTTLTLTLSGAVAFGETVTYDYARSGTTDDIKDAAGNYLADFSAAGVTNNVTGTVTVAVDDAHITYSPYNWRLSGSSYALTNNPGAYLKFGFVASGITLNVDVSALVSAGIGPTSYPAIAWKIDGGEWQRTQLTSSTTEVVLATGLSGIPHYLDLVFVGVDWQIDRWTTPVAQLNITGFTLPQDGYTYDHPVQFSGQMIFYGDSNAEGHEALATGVTVANQDASVSFALLFGWALDCEVGVVGFAGQGYTQTLGDTASHVPDLEDTWDQYSDGVSRLSGGAFIGGDPDYIVSHEAENDQANDVTTAVGNLIAAWRAAAPSAAIIIASPAYQGHYSELSAAVSGSGDDNAFWVPIPENLLLGGDSNGGVHVSALHGHPKYAAYTLAGYLSQVTGGGGAGVSGSRIFLGM